MQLGQVQELTIERIQSVGAFLTGNLLLPKKFLTPSMKVGDKVRVFVLRDSEDRPVASTQEPKIQCGGLAMLTVKDVTRIGAFLDWGMDKDLFLPFQEQLHRVKVGEKVLVACYIDKSERICATMRVNPFFQKPDSVRVNETLEGEVYAVNPDLGAFVLVEGRYNGMIANDQRKAALRVGQKIHARVMRIKPDGKIDLSMNSKAHEELDRDAHQIATLLKANGGFLRVNDKSDPQKIRTLFGFSKAQFKRSVGHLLKLGMIKFEGDGIRLRDRRK